MRFLFVQPGVVSTCNVTERISFVNSFAAVLRKGVLVFVWIFLSIFEARFQRFVGFDSCLFGQSLVCHFLQNSAPALFSTLIVFFCWIPALVVHCGSEAAPFPCTARLGISSRPRHVWSASAATLNHSDQVSDCGQHASRARLTTRLATVHAWRCFSKRLFASREPTLLNLTHDCNVAPVDFCSCADVQNPVARCAET